MEKEKREGLSLFEWIIALVLIVSVWLIFGRHLTTLFVGLLNRFKVPPTTLLFYLQQHLHFILLALTLLLFIWRVVKSPLKTFVTNSPKFRWPLFFFAFGVWIVAIILYMLLFSTPSIIYSPPQNLANRLLFMAVALVVTPLQSLVEELLFRVTFWRMLEGRLKSNLLISLISGGIFTLFHLFNLEVAQAPIKIIPLLYYFLAGFVFMMMTTSHRGGEAAMGAHVANNLFLALVVNYQGSSLTSDAWFTLAAPPIWGDLILLIICGLIVIRYGKRIGVKD